MIGAKADTRMQKLMFPDLKEVGDRTTGLRKDIAVRIADAVTSVLPYMKENIDWDPVFKHHFEVVELSRRLIRQKDVDDGLKEAEKYEKEYKQMLDEIENNPTLRSRDGILSLPLPIPE